MNARFHLVLIMTFQLTFFMNNLIAEDLKLYVDVSYLTVDLKYHSERGAQICEIQQGAPSMLTGHTVSNGGRCQIVYNLLEELNKFFEHSWAVRGAFSDPVVRSAFLYDEKWTMIETVQFLSKDQLFLNCAAQPVKDLSDISSYHGFVFAAANKNDNRAKFQDKYPGVILIDNATFQLRRDKYNMTQLLMGHPLTEKHKPKWGIYSKVTEEGLAQKINEEIGSDLLVIKPIDGFHGKGIIMLKKEDLKEAFDYIFKRKPKGLSEAEAAYEYWLDDDSDQFLIEEFIEVEPVALSHLEGKLYSPTLRLAFLLIYNRLNIEVIYLGGYNYYPSVAITEEGSLTDKYKTAYRAPFHSKGDPEILNKAADQMKKVLSIVYQKLLGLKVD